MDLTTILLVCSAIAITFIIAMFIPLRDIEDGVSSWFERVTQRPRWFMVWILVALAWMPLRVLLLKQHFWWYTTDTDSVTAIILWSVVPFMVENVMKTATAKSMELLIALVTSVKDLVTNVQDLVTKVTTMLLQQTKMVEDLGAEQECSRKRDAQIIQLLQDLEARDEAMHDLYSRLVDMLKDDSEGGDDPAG